MRLCVIHHCFTRTLLILTLIVRSIFARAPIIRAMFIPALVTRAYTPPAFPIGALSTVIAAFAIFTRHLHQVRSG
jgi:hypothetical protein